MGQEIGRSPAGMLEQDTRRGARDRLDEGRAREILERAAALDAERSSEIEIDQLREAAAAAGISHESFEQAMREHAGSRDEPGSVHPLSQVTAPGRVEVARYGDLLRDLLGDQARITVVEDRIEARDDDGVTVSITPSSGEATAAIAAEGSVQRRLMAIILPAIVPAFVGFLLALDSEDAGIGMMIGVVFTVLAAGVGTLISSRRERKELEKKADRIRRQLQRMLGSGA